MFLPLLATRWSPHATTVGTRDDRLCRCSTVRSTPASSMAQSLHDPREAGAAEVVHALFGEVSSNRAYGRQALSEREVTEESRFSARRKELTYGEFDLDFFFELLRAARPQPSEMFVDVGSGCGRLVLAAALARDWEQAAGIELLGGLHAMAERTHAALRDASEADGIPLAPCSFVHGEAEAGLRRLITPTGARAVVFVYASCWPSVGPHLTALSKSLAAVLPQGSRVVTVDKQAITFDFVPSPAPMNSPSPLQRPAFLLIRMQYRRATAAARVIGHVIGWRAVVLRPCDVRHAAQLQHLRERCVRV